MVACGCSGGAIEKWSVLGMFSRQTTQILLMDEIWRMKGKSKSRITPSLGV